MTAGAGGPVVGADAGGTKLMTVRLGEDGTVSAGTVRPVPRTGEQMVAEVVDAARRLSGGRPAALGLGAPGLVNRSGALLYAPNLPGAGGTDLGAALRHAEPAAGIWVGNDATAACWAEYRMGAGSGSRHVLMVTLGTGIGGGVVAAGRLIEGANGFAGEFGHMVVDPAGPLCACGQNGCWETFASGAALGRLARESAAAGRFISGLQRAGGDPGSVRGEDVTAAAAVGDRQAIDVLAGYAWWVALGLANLTNVFDPEVVVVGGGVVAAGGHLLAPVRRAFGGLVEAPALRRAVRIEAAVLGPAAGAVGAALLAADAGRGH